MVTLLPFDPTLHIRLLEAWLHQPHVRAHWGDPAVNLATVLVIQSPAGCALIAADELPVGFVQWQPIGAAELLEGGVTVPDDDTIDIDIFIGEATYLGRGIAPAALRLLRQQLAETGAAKRLSLFTSFENERALRAYQKAGFQMRSQYLDGEDGWATVLLMEIRA